MPLYRYKCQACDAEFEKIVSISERDGESQQCPECGCDQIDRMISKTNFALKGGGWYKDGYLKKE